MTDYNRTVVNATTGEVTVVPLTDDEVASFISERNKIELERAEAASKRELELSARARAFEKLSSLGLTDEEIKAIVG